MKSALITGLTGQDGALLARLLLQRGYRVIGAVRRSASAHGWRLEELGIADHPNLSLRSFDLLDADRARLLIEEVHPDEVYNLAAQSSASASFDEPMLTLQAVGAAPLRLLETIRRLDPTIRFFQASSAEMFGLPRSSPQDEDTPLRPRTPYGAAKVYAHWMTESYRATYGMFCCSGILYNHESSLRSPEFVTRKITDSVAKIKLGRLDCLRLGRLDTRRDWGYAPDYVEAMYRMMQVAAPGTYVLATGRATSIREFASMAFAAADMQLEFDGTAAAETAIERKTGRTVIRVDAALYRPVEAEQLVGNPQRAKTELGWQHTASLEQICSEMVAADLRRNAAGLSL